MKLLHVCKEKTGVGFHTVFVNFLSFVLATLEDVGFALVLTEQFRSVSIIVFPCCRGCVSVSPYARTRADIPRDAGQLQVGHGDRTRPAPLEM